MKTVGEFKKAGLVFVKGDHTIESDGSSSKGDINFNTDLNFNKYNHFDSSPILEFAWRENAGVKPEFSGLVDVKFSTGSTLSSYDKNLLGWNKAGAALPIIEWRPSLNQPSEKMKFALDEVDEISAKVINDKPIFTQAMADEYTPQSGCECEIMLDGHWQKCFIVGLSKKGNPVIEIGAHCVESVGCKYRATDTRTDRKMAVDAALSEWPVADKLTLEIAYDFWRVGELAKYDE